MKLLFDQNLSPRLPALLDDVFPGSKHVVDIGLDRSSDHDLWEYARENDYVIVTKDVDFSDRSAIIGFPPKIIWIRLGNTVTLPIEAAIRKNLESIESFYKDKDLGVIALFG